VFNDEKSAFGLEVIAAQEKLPPPSAAPHQNGRGNWHGDMRGMGAAAKPWRKTSAKMA
jgi:hypothetical protein